MLETNAPDQVKFWNDWHEKINKRDPNFGSQFPFAEEVLPVLKEKSTSPILDLGCGQCNDSIYFAKQRFEVHALDFSSLALQKARSTIQSQGLHSIFLYERDMALPLPFENEIFGAVYSHLSLHYFDDKVTQSVFSEIRRVLKPEGLLGFVVKSVKDVRYGEGEEIGPDMFNYKGHVRHFFKKEYVEDLLREWNILLLEEYDACYGGSQEASSFIKVIAEKQDHLS